SRRHARFPRDWRSVVCSSDLLVALSLGVPHWATRPTWVPVFTGLPLGTIGEVTQRLDEAGIEYRREQGGGAILGSADDVARARERGRAAGRERGRRRVWDGSE